LSNQFDRNKILSHLDSINSYCSHKNLSSPLLVELDLTNICNHDCPGCTGFRMEGGLNSTIATSDALDIIDDLKSCGVKAVTFTGGGDPTMHRDFDEIIKHAADIGLEVGLITNGLAIKERHLDSLLSSCMWIRVSWDACTPDMHRKIHYGGDLNKKMSSDKQFWKVIDNTKMLCEYKTKHNIDCVVGCAFLVGEETQDDIIGFAELASRSSVDYCQYRPFHYSSYNKDIEDLMHCARKLYQTDSFVVLFSEFKFQSMKENNCNRTYDICHGSHFSTHISANYKVYMCCHLMFSEEANIGDLKESSFTEIWRSERKNKVINGVDVHKCVPLCRHDSANKILQIIVSSDGMSHKNFL